MEEQTYVSPKEAIRILGVHPLSLKNWETNGKIECIRTPGGKRMYNVKKYLNSTKPVSTVDKINICYCRVSTKNQKDDLQRQIDYMKDLYPNYEIYSEIGSGLNMNRKKLQKIIYLAIEGKVGNIIVAYKDRLARFGFELIENIINKYSNGKIIILNKINLSPEEEITKDLLSIINVFSARVNGLRKYKKKIKQIENIEK
jgi:predicted site-specific integrase-resolvase